MKTNEQIIEEIWICDKCKEYLTYTGSGGYDCKCSHFDPEDLIERALELKEKEMRK